MIYLAIFGAVLVTNVIPAFAPPTWAVLVLFRIHTSANPWPSLILGVVGAVLGRYFLAKAFTKIGPRLKPAFQENLQAASTLLQKRKSLNIITLLLFAFAPVSSAQLFEAAGLTRIKMRPLLVAFAIGRTISYAGYVFGVSALKNAGVGKTLIREITSPWALVLQVVLLISFVPLTRVNWKKFLHPQEQ